jgi:hypothetical protein
MTRHRIAQIGKNRNPKSPETGPEPAVSCGNDYFRRAPRPPCSTAWRFFTADYLKSGIVIRTETNGLFHYIVPDEDFEVVGRSTAR